MGKSDASINLPTNASLSYTLDSLTSTVTLESTQASHDSWQPFDASFELSPASQQRFLAHLNNLKSHFEYTGHFIVKSNNNFPFGCGLASSASSFAALTKCAVMALCDVTRHPDLTITEQAILSRQGSGSSCRSFYSPWALWHDDMVEPVSLPYEQLLHQVIIIDPSEKQVSSSKAHHLVTTSHKFLGRTERAQQRLQQLLNTLQQQDWHKSFQICWDEFNDMHQLFETSSPSFTYMTERCQTVLAQLQEFWQKNGNGPLVTMDAGPNIHLLYRSEDFELKQKFEHDQLQGKFDVI